nr:hypothetical protein FVER53263_00942 [Fusarium verticillioides]
MAALNIRYSQYEPPPPVPHPTRAGIAFAHGSQLTAHGSRSITRAGVKMFPAEEINTPAPILDRYKLAIRVGDVNEPFKIPKSLQSLVKATRKKFPTIDLGQGTNALKSINVNIKQFLQCENRPDDVKLFKSRKELIVWTRKRGAFFPRHQLPKGSPLRTLLKHMFN